MLFRSDQRVWNLTSGIEQRFATGTDLAVSTQMSRQSYTDPNDVISPNPFYRNSVNLTLSQPLLRGFGTDVNLANLRIARNQDRRSLQLMRQTLLVAVARTESLYWQVYLARARLVSAQWLLQVGEQAVRALQYKSPAEDR